ncbi:hypothetical protein IF803_19975 [Bradyrhizobium sp. UFLA06-06]
MATLSRADVNREEAKQELEQKLRGYRGLSERFADDVLRFLLMDIIKDIEEQIAELDRRP